MRKCNNCGAMNPDNAASCVNCGYNLTTYNTYSTSPARTVYRNEPDIPYEYTPISAWGYFGYSLLFNIPIVGFILLIVFSFSSDNINRKNFARSYFCAMLVFGLLFLIFALLLPLLGITVIDFDAVRRMIS